MSGQTTQDPEFSLVDHLRQLKIDLESQRFIADRAVAHWSAKSDDPRASVELSHAEVRTVWCKEKEAALEQTIAVLEVLDHPGFSILNRTRALEAVGPYPATPVEEACMAGITGPNRKKPIKGYGATPVEALLKAHASLKSQEVPKSNE